MAKNGNIQNSLFQIDRDLSWQRLFFTEPCRRYPLIFCAIGLMTGIIIQYDLAGPLFFWGLVLLSTGLLASLYLVTVRQFYVKIGWLCMVVLVSFVSLGAIRMCVFTQLPPHHIRQRVGSEAAPVNIEGMVLTAPRVNRSKWAFSSFMFTDPSTGFYLKCTRIQTVDGWQPANGTIRIYIPHPVYDLYPADRIRAYSVLEPIESGSNPGQFDPAAYYTRQNIFIQGQIPSRQAVTVLDRNTGFLRRLRGQFQQICFNALFQDIQNETADMGLLEALLLGKRTQIKPVTWRAFEKTGLLHFISLSGMHLGIIVGLVWVICKMIGLTKPWRAVVALCAIGLFLMIVPARAPTVRAAVIACIFCLSVIVRRHTHPLNSLSLAAIVLLLIRPTFAFEPGWQLSFACVLGILFLAPTFYRHFLKWLSMIRIQPSHPLPQTLFRALAGLLATGIAAWFGGAGILLYHFNAVTPLSSIWTVLIFPLVAILMILGFIKMIVSAIIPLTAIGIGWLVNQCASVLIGTVTVFSRIGFSDIRMAAVQPTVIVVYYIFLISLLIPIRYPKRALALRGSLFVVLIGLLLWPGVHSLFNPSLTMTCLDVKHGQAIFLELPDRTTWLFDAGSLFSPNVGRRIVNPFLRHQGIGRMDGIVISHSDIDHLNGIAEILEENVVECIYPGPECRIHSNRYTMRRLDQSSKDNAVMSKSTDRLTIDPPVRIEFLWPHDAVLDKPDITINDQSLVTRLTYKDRSVLICSDIQQYAQSELLQRYPNLKADILIAPHHGSTNTLKNDFIRTINPTVVIASSSAKTDRQFQKLKEIAGTELFVTGNDGAVTTTIRPDGSVDIRSFKSKHHMRF